MGDLDLDDLEALEQAATPGEWDAGDYWHIQGANFCPCKPEWEPAVVQMMNINGTRMLAHRHRRPEAWDRTVIQTQPYPDGFPRSVVITTREYGEIDPRDAEFIAAFRNAAPALISAARERDKYWDAICAYAADVSRLERENNELRARIDAALACYGPDPSKRLGESRWRSADEFLIAIRTALTTPTKEQKA